MDYEFYCEGRTASGSHRVTIENFLSLYENSACLNGEVSLPFSRERINHLSRLCSQTDRELSTLLPQGLLDIARNNNLSLKQSRSSQKKIEEAMMVTGHSDFPDIYPILENGNYVLAKRLSDENLRRFYAATLEGASSLVARGFSALLIRPEVKHISSLIYQYLENHGFEITYSKPLVLDFDQYWGIYEHTFGDPIKEGHVRRRIFGYVGRETELLLFRDPEERFGVSGAELAEGMKDKYKGTAGSYDGETLRGGVIYAEIFFTLNSSNPLFNYALDPISQYKYANANQRNSGNVDHVISNLPGVHLPEGHEVVKDLSIMLTDKDLEYLEYK